MSDILQSGDVEDNLISILTIIAKKSGLFVAKRNDVSFTIPQAIALWDHYDGGTNSLNQLKQSLKAFGPGLKSTLQPLNIQKHVSTLEKKGVIPSKIIDVKCTVTKTGNKKRYVHILLLFQTFTTYCVYV